MPAPARTVTYSPITNEFTIGEGRPLILPQVMWHITDRCPLACPYCFATKSGVSVSLEAVPKTLSLFRTLEVQKIDIAGGEPLIHPELPFLLRAASEKGFALTLTTAGVGIAQNRRWIIQNSASFTRIIVSVDGSRQMHDNMRRLPGAFEAARTLVGDLRDTSANNIRINSVLVRPTIQGRGLRELAFVVAELCPSEWCLIQPHPANRKTLFDSYCLTDQEFWQAVQTVEQIVGQEALTVGRIITRCADDYSGYWVLYPDGILRQHTKGPDDTGSINFLATPLDVLVREIQIRGVSLPIEPQGK